MSMPTKSKFFRVAVEGDTTDGRKIERSWLEQMAAGYDRAKYGARIFMEHIRGVLPDGPFRAYGDVTALKTEEIVIGGEKKLALLAQIEPTPDLVAMTKASQKIYSSMEVDTNFAKSGQAYLVGLGVTDSPASLGTEMLAFAAGAKANPLAVRKQAPDNLFTAATEIQLEFETEAPNAGDSLFSKVVGLLKGKDKKDDDRFADAGKAIEALAESQRDLLGQFATLQGQLKAATGKLAAEAAAAKDREAFAALQAKLDQAPAGSRRPAAAGGTGAQVTDC
jgi:hypothetical protein